MRSGKVEWQCGEGNIWVPCRMPLGARPKACPGQLATHLEQGPRADCLVFMPLSKAEALRRRACRLALALDPGWGGTLLHAPLHATRSWATDRDHCKPAARLGGGCG